MGIIEEELLSKVMLGIKDEENLKKKQMCVLGEEDVDRFKKLAEVVKELIDRKKDVLILEQRIQLEKNIIWRDICKKHNLPNEKLSQEDGIIYQYTN